jgi:parvulin-like peptidyl-prolyl isomerase
MKYAFFPLTLAQKAGKIEKVIAALREVPARERKKGIKTNMMKRLLALLLALVMLSAVAVGCSEKKTTDAPGGVDKETQELYDTVVLTVNGENITYELYRYYFYGLYSNKLSENPDFFKEEGALEELRKAVLDEIKLVIAVKALAKKYKIEPTEKEIKEIDDYIAALKSYMGANFAQTLAAQYTSEKLLREMLIYEQYTYGALFEYFTSEECTAIDRSDAAVTEFMKDYNCAVHILLTEKTYTSKENMEKVAMHLEELIALGRGAAEILDGDSSVEEAVAEIDKFIAKYEDAKSKMSYIGGLSVYVKRLQELKKQLTAENGATPAIDYLVEAVSKITGETAVTEVKNLASSLKNDGITDKSLTSWSVAYAAYNDMLAKEKDAYSESDEAAWPSVAKQDVLFAMELVGALLKDHGSDQKTNLVKLTEEKLGNVFVEVTLVFGEDRQNPEVGVYFKKGETNEAFEKAFFELEFGKVSRPTYTDFGLHLILRQETDLQYFKENMYDYFAGLKLADDLSANYEVTYAEIYETITPDTLK